MDLILRIDIGGSEVRVILLVLLVLFRIKVDGPTQAVVVSCFFSSRRRHTRYWRDWSSDVCSSDLQKIAGEKYRVLDRFEQQADTFKIMQIEKMMAYIFLTFILVVACFNIIGSLSMLIIDKKKDVATLRSLGADDKQITRIFLLEGRMISALGAVIGIGLGLLLCWLQQTYGLVKMGERSGSFVINSYPVSVHYVDVLLVFLTVMAVGWIAVWYPVRYFTRENK